MQSKFIKESLRNILKPKSKEDIDDAIKPFITLMKKCYNYIKSYPNYFEITSELQDKFVWNDYFYFNFIIKTDFKYDFVIAFEQDETPTGLYITDEYDGIGHPINSLNDLKKFLRRFDYPEYNLKESLGDILKPKSQEEIDRMFPQNIKDLFQKCYEFIAARPKLFEITSKLSFKWDNFGFEFKTTIPLNDGIGFHGGEIGEYSLIYDDNEVSLIFINNGYSTEIKHANDFIYYLSDYTDLNESLSNNLFKPKSKEQLKQAFEEKYPKFAQIFHELFPYEEYELDDKIEVKIAFRENNKNDIEKTFMLSQDTWKILPTITVLDTTYSGQSFGNQTLGGVFRNSRTVSTANDVYEYIKNS